MRNILSNVFGPTLMFAQERTDGEDFDHKSHINDQVYLNFKMRGTQLLKKSKCNRLK